jgi:hypothetical protein
MTGDCGAVDSGDVSSDGSFSITDAEGIEGGVKIRSIPEGEGKTETNGQ